ncbi:MAG: hypothetical protein IKB65_08375 [Ruminiclostridium sp.]|nr:hypothetical protein [Ruminiclostridium sp.]
MKEGAILDLFWQRDEGAIAAVKTKYGPYCAVTGHWCAGSPLALAVLNLEDYCGLQANGVNYYFVEE